MDIRELFESSLYERECRLIERAWKRTPINYCMVCSLENGRFRVRGLQEATSYDEILEYASQFARNEPWFVIAKCNGKSIINAGLIIGSWRAFRMLKNAQVIVVEQSAEKG